MKTGQLLETVMTKRAAKTIICVAWAYSACIGLPLALLHPDGDIRPNRRVACYFNRAASTVWRGSIIILIIIIIYFQVLNYHLLRQQLRAAAQIQNLSQGKIKLYKRAMKTCTLITGAFLIGWFPLVIGSMLFDWLPNDRATIIEVNHYFRILFILQGFSNVVIFRMRNLYPRILNLFQRMCLCQRNPNAVYPM